MTKPNLVILHAHDMGRYNSLYGHHLPTPNLERWAAHATVFRNAHCAAPTCSPSRAAMLTGRVAHRTGVLGLIHRGWDLSDQNQHLARILGSQGWKTAMSGVQHEYDPKGPSPYDETLVPIPDRTHSRDVGAATAAAQWLEQQGNEPFYLWCGLFYPHLPHPPHDPDLGPDRLLPPPILPDSPQARSDWAGYATALREADKAFGVVLEALERTGLAKNTVVLVTTDHGVPFPRMKCRLTGHGTGVTLALRDPRRPSMGDVTDALVSHLDVVPTLCELLGADAPGGLDGNSLLPLLTRRADAVHGDIFAEVSYHATYEPMRAVRTLRYNYIRRYEDPAFPAGANIDRSLTKSLLVENGYIEMPQPVEELYDLLFDPQECHNLVPGGKHGQVLEDMRQRLDRWMVNTQDPLLKGPVPSPGAGFVDARTGRVDPGSKA